MRLSAIVFISFPSLFLKAFSTTSPRLFSICCLRTCSLPGPGNGITLMLSVMSKVGLLPISGIVQQRSESPSQRESRFVLIQVWTVLTIACRLDALGRWLNVPTGTKMLIHLPGTSRDLSSSMPIKAALKNAKSSFSPTNGSTIVCSIARLLLSDLLIARTSTAPSILLSSQSISASAHEWFSYAERNRSIIASSLRDFVGTGKSCFAAPFSHTQGVRLNPFDSRYPADLNYCS